MKYIYVQCICNDLFANICKYTYSGLHSKWKHNKATTHNTSNTSIFIPYMVLDMHCDVSLLFLRLLCRPVFCPAKTCTSTCTSTCPSRFPWTFIYMGVPYISKPPHLRCFIISFFPTFPSASRM